MAYLMYLSTGFILAICSISPSSDLCNQFHENCESCISGGGPLCAWCTTPVIEANASFSRCGRHDLMKTHCKSDRLVYSRSSVEPTKIEHSLMSAAIESDPTNVVIKIRPNDPVKFNVSFKQVSDYPVDLYFLMDLSNSMVDDKHRLSQLVKQLATKMRNITSDFRLGFGSYVEKPIMPFVSIGTTNRSHKSCALQNQNGNITTTCIPAYSFKHHLSLTNDSEEFASQVEKTKVSRNIDEPEGGLDALMQVIVCEKIIGWRPNSRRLIVFSTDAGLHFAGDGKLAGIIEPNDEKCHLSRVYDQSFGRFVYEYTESTRQDYPSFGQIYAKLMEYNVNIIFAVTSRQVPLYTEIANFLEAAVVGELDDDSSNIVDLVAMNYKKITNRMRLMFKASGDAKVVKEGKVFLVGNKVKIGLDPECRPVAVNGEKKDARCEIGLGEQLTVNVMVHLDECVNNQSVTLYPYGMINAGLKMEIYSQCKCECIKSKKDDKKICNDHGNYHCGVCQCAEGYFGRNCECDGESESDEALLQRCKRPESNVLCSGRGQCLCGKCNCFKREAGEKISGEFCECDNFSCPRWNGHVCSGHGACQCDGSCLCHLGWTGYDCACTSNTVPCMSNASGLLCNGKGICECGTCICNPSEDFLGPTCEECPTCERGCIDTRDCVRCMAFQTGPLNEKECLQCPYKLEIIDDFAVNERFEHGSRRFCQFADSDGCTFFYFADLRLYSYQLASNGNTVLRVKREKSCPLPLPFWLVSTVITSSILIVGALALATWRITVTIQDRNEIAEFDRDSDKTKWIKNKNPIYRQASMTYGNPLYRQRSRVTDQ